MLRIDAHQHFWIFDPVRDSWINEDMKVIQRDFLPNDLYPLLQQNSIDGCVAVQADQSLQETGFLLSLAESNAFIKGVVGWADLQSENIKEQLEGFSQSEKLKGFRHIVQAEPDSEFLLRPNFVRGVSYLRQFDYTYDILIYPQHLKYAERLVSKFPDQRFIVDHIAKPLIKDHKTDGWKSDIEAIANHENTWCKVSGMVTEANWKSWRKEDFKPYLDTVFEAFGSKRVVFGSDWPVCQVAASYENMVGIVKDYLDTFSADEQSAFWGGNAISFYNLI